MHFKGLNMLFYINKIQKDNNGKEFTVMNRKPSKTYEKAVARAKKVGTALICSYPNRPVALFRNGIEVLSK
jgi:hypothetical protein